jgi:hypothetical protein
MKHYELYKSLCKTKVIFFIAFVYIPIIFFTLYLDALLTCLIFGFHHTFEFTYTFQQPWWKTLKMAVLQYFVLCFLYGLWSGLKQVIIRNKDLFIS